MRAYFSAQKAMLDVRDYLKRIAVSPLVEEVPLAVGSAAQLEYLATAERAAMEAHSLALDLIRAKIEAHYFDGCKILAPRCALLLLFVFVSASSHPRVHSIFRHIACLRSVCVSGRVNVLYLPRSLTWNCFYNAAYIYIVVCISVGWGDVCVSTVRMGVWAGVHCVSVYSVYPVFVCRVCMSLCLYAVCSVCLCVCVCAVCTSACVCMRGVCVCVCVCVSRWVYLFVFSLDVSLCVCLNIVCFRFA
eukprot:Opistho-2@14029